ncbi:MAG: methyltransferase domain-containing protein [Deltaproteobacteria bacterium]|nr:methyltransferase domain-containing protein [Deltaproteobacteria bacterium]
MPATSIASSLDREDGSSARSDDARFHAAQAVRAYYRRTAWDFHLVWSPCDFHFGLYEDGCVTHRAALRNTNRLLADLAGVGAGSRVLDAGCGVGGTTLWLARERGAEVTGVTLVPEQVEIGRRRAERGGLAHLAEFREADYTDTGLEPASFDAVVAAESLCHAPDKAAFYREAARLLRPGGRLVMTEYMRTPDITAADDARLLDEWLAGWALAGIDTADSHRGYAKAAGFDEVRVEDCSERFRRSLRRLYLVSGAGYPLAWIAWRLGIRDDVQHGNVVGSIRFYQALRRRSWSYGLLTATKPATPEAR